MAERNPKNTFYRLLKLDKNIWETIKIFKKIKKEMLKDCSKREAGK